MTCKDCVHYAVCEDAREFDNYEVYDIICDHSKNKADFVEVIRCKNYAYANSDGTIFRYGVGRSTKPDGYCSNGERRCDNA